MMRSVAIIGSFQKYYEDILGLIALFKENGFQVTSPYQSRITESRWGFVIFEADDKSQTEDEIQTDTLRKILNADAVYVYNPKQKPESKGGYVGKTTCYEIGILMSKNTPLFYLEYPDDLPVPVAPSQIISPQDFIGKFKANEAFFTLPHKNRAECDAAQRDVFSISSLIICGSMKFFNEMKIMQQELANLGICAIIPGDETHLPENISDEAFNVFKQKVSRSYFKKIRHTGTLAILVYNEQKNNLENYIGANTFAEIAMAFSWGRKIFIYNDVYQPYADELRAWDAVVIRRDLKIVQKFFDKKILKTADNAEIFQMSLFDNFGKGEHSQADN